jgi:hypothetical protein
MSDPQMIRVCLECDGNEEIQTLNAGDEWWSFCDACQSVEGKTEEITEEEWELRQ